MSRKRPRTPEHFPRMKHRARKRRARAAYHQAAELTRLCLAEWARTTANHYHHQLAAYGL